MYKRTTGESAPAHYFVSPALLSILAVLYICFLLGCSGEDVSSQIDGDTGTVEDIEEDSLDTGEESLDSVDDVDAHPVPEDSYSEPDVDDGDKEYFLHDQWEECDCPHPEDMCSPWQCGRPDIFCGPGGEECPEGYACILIGVSYDHALCVCEHGDCSIRCEDSTGCPANPMVCNPGDGRCHLKGQTCQSNIQCARGSYCDRDNDRVCEPTGPGEEGDPCDDGRDCMSGTCMLGECSEQCITDEDCPAEAPHCLQQATLHDNGCREYPAYCFADCADDEICIGDECMHFCSSSADCLGADCAIPPSFMPNMPPYCTPPEDSSVYEHCKPEEFIDLINDHCFLPGLCYTEDDCDEPYFCDGFCRRNFGD